MSEKDAQIKQAQVEAQLRDLESISRIVGNTLNLIADMDIKGSHVEPVLEIVNYNRGFKKQIDAQIDTLKSTLPTKTGLDVPENSPLAESAPNVAAGAK